MGDPLAVAVSAVAFGVNSLAFAVTAGVRLADGCPLREVACKLGWALACLAGACFALWVLAQHG
jgi:hypothetical protein